ncbi:growth/differentiation factor 2 [Bombina bombina]|uniref:growth/differentiation factor 2 n=1 Tax=Bombina bombina TaxID=8345 RepID=UPI00235A5DC8|nr:growth/differentiation factor 2 [Bombina bombina]
MRSATLSVFCSLFLTLAGFSHTRSLREFTHEDAIRGHKEKREEVSLSLDAFIENMKQDFLRSLNLSNVPNLERTNSEPPQYMMDLYNRYAKDKSSMPMSNIVRSYQTEDIMMTSSIEDTVESHILLFNASVPSHEDVTRAELKFHVTLNDRHIGQLLVYDVLHFDPSENLRDTKALIDSKQIDKSKLLTIDVTRAVKRWLKTDQNKNKLEIFLKTNESLEALPKSGVTLNGSDPPLLIVFSDDKCNKMKESRTELREMIAHEPTSGIQTFYKDITNEKQDEVNKKRRKRSLKDNYCRKTSLIVNFEELGWNSWIIAPKSYDANQCKGECYYPLTDNLKPTKHAIVQMLMHHNSPQKIRKPCCVPTQLESIQVLYKDENGVITLKNKYEDMKVAQCGCR